MRILAVAALLAAVIAAPAQSKNTYVRGYVKPSTGTHVPPSFRTAPNRTKLDNWSSKPNVNPYTGKPGTKDPYAPKR